ncbi:serine hydrolase [uncultured Anaerotruncus sp.]|uniref:D-alanyl-D-alanine carboxypeptidase family protein n=1 Tax=uncultured Anaerotruncus sp. TaxID=905011 RepID=UPI00280A604D|nr:serine hydrolase [uncultured Anaerotruncus sp.]
MKRWCAFLLALTVACTMLATPLLAAPKDGGSSAGSSENSSGDSSSEPASGASDGAGSASSGASLSPYVPPDEELYQSQGIYLLNVDSGEPVYNRNEMERIQPASLTKIMTALVVLESDHDLDAETTELKTYIQNYLYNLQAGDGGIYQGVQFTLRDLLYGSLTQSVNAAAMMLADYVGNGSIEDFCVMMNQKAKEIGAKNTHFSNPTGLYIEGEENYTTAYDMALIAQYAMQNEDYMEMANTRVYTAYPAGGPESGITWISTNRMINAADTDGYYYEGLRGIKTGTLPEPGQGVVNFVSTATRDGYTYLAVCLGAPYRSPDGEIYANNLAFRDTARLYDWAFDNFRVKTLMSVGEEVAGVNVRLSWDTDYIKLFAADKFATLVNKDVTGDDIEPQVEIFNAVERPVKGQKGKVELFIDAPVEKGQEVGRVKLMLMGEEVGSVSLVAGETVEASVSLVYLEKVKAFFGNFIFKFILVFVIIVVVLYIALMIVRNHNKRRYQAKRRRPPQQKR